MTAPIISVENLRTFFYTDEGIVRAVDGVSFEVHPGETVGIVGESGSGKSVTAASIMRLIAPPGRIVGGRIDYRGEDILAMDDTRIRRLRGGQVAMIFQDPMTSLNPVLRVSSQLEEAMLVHGRFNQDTAAARAVELLGKMGLPTPQRAVRNYPHQFSGGMRQRVMLAMGFGNEPTLLIADEPTTALDVTIQAQILELLKQLNDEFGVAIILISHDLGVVANLCSRVLVMYGGQIVEQGATAEVLADPKHPYTWALINAVPRLDRSSKRRLVSIGGTPPDLLDPPTGCRFAPRCPFRIERCAELPPLMHVAPDRLARCWVTASGETLPEPASNGHSVAMTPRQDGPATPDPAADQDLPDSPLLELADLVKLFPVQGGGHWFSAGRDLLHAVDGVSLSIQRGETVGLVGESGSGKTTLGRLIVGLYPPTSGRINFDGQEITHARGARRRALRGQLQMIFQDPYSSLNPRKTVLQALEEPLLVHRLVPDRVTARNRVHELLALVGLDPKAAQKFPYEFSGGQRQRIAIARALAVEPVFIVADEPVSSLDVNIQAQVINLLEDLQERLSLTSLFIAHDLSVVRHVSDRIAVMYLGKIMELAKSEDLYQRPLHPYARALISAAPIPDAAVARDRQPIPLHGEIPSPINLPSGCRFRTRCPIAQPVCAEVEPPLVEHAPGQFAACHFPGEL